LPVQEGDTIVLDIEERRIDLDVPPNVLKGRLASWKAPEPRYKTGVYAKYIAMVSSASEGAITSRLSQ